MASEVPALTEFVQSCRVEFRFLVDHFGFREVPCSVQQERFCVRFAKEDRSVEMTDSANSSKYCRYIRPSESHMTQTEGRLPRRKLDHSVRVMGSDLVLAQADLVAVPE
jgi:hypothetical protein